MLCIDGLSPTYDYDSSCQNFGEWTHFLPVDCASTEDRDAAKLGLGSVARPEDSSGRENGDALTPPSCGS